MSDKQTIEAWLDIQMYVYCPNDDCGTLINLLDERDTDAEMHNDDGALLRQMFPKNGDNADFVCDEVTCSACKTTFNVEGLAW